MGVVTPPPTPAEIDRVLDTNVVAYSITSGLVDAETTDFYRDQLENHTVAISFQTWAELRVGAIIQSRSLDDLRAAIAGCTIIPYSDLLLDAYVHLRSRAHERNRAGRGPLLGAADGWIAATAFLLDVPLVTHDRRLSRIDGIRVITALPDPQ